MLSLNARLRFQQKDEQASEQLGILRDLPQIFRSMPRQWMLQEADKHARDSLVPPSGARATMTLLDI
jgi:hypothetical protein